MEFYKFLERQLKQPSKDLSLDLSCRKDFVPSKEIKLQVNKVTYSKTQFGEYAYRVEVANKILKNLTFDLIENNIFNILYNSKPSVRYAFYAGFFEAEGSILEKSKNLTFSFGFNLLKERSNEDILNLLKKVVLFKYLLSFDGFNPMISRKVGNTEKSKTLKYDIRLLCSKENRLKEVNFIKSSILPYITYKKKKEKILKLEEEILLKRKKQAELVKT